MIRARWLAFSQAVSSLARKVSMPEVSGLVTFQ